MKIIQLQIIITATEEKKKQQVATATIIIKAANIKRKINSKTFAINNFSVYDQYTFLPTHL